MNNPYFESMRRKGILHNKLNKNHHYDLYSIGEHIAFKYWAISEMYNSTSVIVDHLPSVESTNEFIQTFINADIYSIVLVGDAVENIIQFYDFGAYPIGKRTVFFKESKLYNGNPESVTGLEVMLLPLHAIRQF